jgi:hypothetical protein
MSLRDRRLCPQGIAAIVHTQRLQPLGRRMGKVLLGKQSAVELAVSHDALGNLPTIEVHRSIRGDAAQRPAKVWLCHHFARVRQLAVGQQLAPGDGKLPQQVGVRVEHLAVAEACGKALLGVADGGLQQLGELASGVSLMQQRPRGYQPRYRRALDATYGDTVAEALPCGGSRGGTPRRSARAFVACGRRRAPRRHHHPDGCCRVPPPSAPR